MTEYAFPSEREAHDVRRSHIDRGESVSLVAHDPTRNLYVFDVFDAPRRIEIPNSSYWAMMRKGHRTGHGHALRGYLVPRPTTTGVLKLVRTCCGE